MNSHSKRFFKLIICHSRESGNLLCLIWDNEFEALANIKGFFRRLRIQALVKEGKGHLIPAKYFADSLPDDLLEEATAFSSRLVSGEKLPNYEETEVEIARITYDTLSLYILSIRARKVGKRIAYRVVGDQKTVYGFAPKTSSKPLTLYQLIQLI